MIETKELVIYPLSKCNLNCFHCYAGKEDYELSIDDLNWINKTFDTRKTIIMGGEPLMYKDLEYMLQVFPNITISTNMTLIKEKIGMLKKYRDKLTIQLSIEGGSQETNKIRGEMIWEICIYMVKLLKENSIACYLRCSYHIDNLQKIIKEVLPLAEKLGVGALLLPRVDKPALNSKEQILFFREVIKHKRCAVHQPHFYQFIEKRGRCLAGNERVNIYFDKRITTCSFDLKYNLGKIGDKEESIKQNIDIFVETFKIPPIECSSCTNSDICRGGCYISKSYIGCPLQKNWGLEQVIINDELDGNKVREDMNLLAKYVEKLGIC